jgi:hypothetical protein
MLQEIGYAPDEDVAPEDGEWVDPLWIQVDRVIDTREMPPRDKEGEGETALQDLVQADLANVTAVFPPETAVSAPRTGEGEGGTAQQASVQIGLAAVALPLPPDGAVGASSPSRKTGKSCGKGKEKQERQYLIKWRGLSYRECTWEAKEKINDDQAIKRFILANQCPSKVQMLAISARTCGRGGNGLPFAFQADQPDMNQPSVLNTLSCLVPPSGQAHSDEARVAQRIIRYSSAQLRAQVRAQILTYYYIVRGKSPPPLLLRLTGSPAAAYQWNISPPPIIGTIIGGHGAAPVAVGVGSSTSGHRTAGGQTGVMATHATATPGTVGTNPAVALLLAELVEHVARATMRPTREPPVLSYTVCLPKTTDGLCMKISKTAQGHVKVAGFKRTANNMQGPAEISGLIRVNDIITGVQNNCVLRCSFVEVVSKLRMVTGSTNGSTICLRLNTSRWPWELPCQTEEMRPPGGENPAAGTTPFGSYGEGMHMYRLPEPGQIDLKRSRMESGAWRGQKDGVSELADHLWCESNTSLKQAAERTQQKGRFVAGLKASVLGESFGEDEDGDEEWEGDDDDWQESTGFGDTELLLFSAQSHPNDPPAKGTAAASYHPVHMPVSQAAKALAEVASILAIHEPKAAPPVEETKAVPPAPAAAPPAYATKRHYVEYDFDGGISEGEASPIKNGGAAPRKKKNKRGAYAILAQRNSERLPLIRAEMVRIYMKHRPENLERIDTILCSWEGREHLIIPGLHAKYEHEADGNGNDGYEGKGGSSSAGDKVLSVCTTGIVSSSSSTLVGKAAAVSTSIYPVSDMVVFETATGDHMASAETARTTNVFGFDHYVGTALAAAAVVIGAALDTDASDTETPGLAAATENTEDHHIERREAGVETELEEQPDMMVAQDAVHQCLGAICAEVAKQGQRQQQIQQEQEDITMAEDNGWGDRAEEDAVNEDVIGDGGGYRTPDGIFVPYTKVRGSECNH